MAAQGRLEVGRRFDASFETGNHRGVGEAHHAQGLAQPAARQEEAAGERVGGREGQDLHVAAHPQMGETVVQQEDVDVGRAIEGQRGGRAAVGADRDDRARRLLGDRQRLVAGLIDRDQGTVAEADHQSVARGHLPTVTARQHRDAEARTGATLAGWAAFAQSLSNRDHRRRLATAAPVQVADADGRPAQARGPGRPT